MIASLFLLLASVALMASAQPITTTFDFQPYANTSVGLGGIQQTVVQLVSALSYTGRNGVSGTAQPGSWIMYGGGEQTAIIPRDTTSAAGTVTAVIIGSPVGNYSEIGCGSRSGSNLFYLIGTPGNAQTQQTNDQYYVLRSTDGVTFTNVLDSATTTAWLGRQNEDNTMCVVFMNGNVYSVGQEDTWYSANQGVTWSKVAASVRFPARTFFSGGVYTTSSGQDTIFVVGGRDAPTAASPYGGNDYNDVWSSADGAASWVRLTAAAGWAPRDQLSWAISSTGLQVVYGGDQYGGYGSFYSDMWSSQDGTNWSMLKANTYIGNYSQSELLFDSQGYLYLFGGQTNGYSWIPVSVRTNVPISSSNNNGAAQFAPSMTVLVVAIIAVVSYLL